MLQKCRNWCRANNIKFLITLLILLPTSSVFARNNCIINEIEGGPNAEYFGVLAGTADSANAIMSGDPVAETPVPENTVKRVALFRFEKDYNPKNILDYGININFPSCTIALTTSGAPSFNTFWIMGEEKGQRKRMTPKDAGRMGAIVISHDPNQVRFRMNALKETNLNKKEITINAEIENGQCVVKGSVELNDGRQVNLRRIFAQISYVLGIPTGVDYLRVEGTDRATGASVNFKMDD